MTDCLLLNTSNGGREYLLLNLGSQSCLLLNSQQGGVEIAGRHATPLIGPRALQLIPVEFTFRLKSCLITKIGLKVCAKSTLRVITKSSFKIKSSILNKIKETYGIKASTLIKERFTSFKVKSNTLVLKKVQAGLFANVNTKNKIETSLTKHKNKKKKEFLLRKLKEMLDEDGRRI